MTTRSIIPKKGIGFEDGIFIQFVQSGTHIAFEYDFVPDCQRWENSCRYEKSIRPIFKNHTRAVRHPMPKIPTFQAV